MTVIRFGGSVKKTTEAVFAASYESPTAVRQIAEDIIGSMDGLSVGNLDAIPPDARLENRSFALPATTALTGLLLPYGLTWYEQAGEIDVFERGIPHLQTAMIAISQDTGMVGTPTITDEGIRVRTLLDHRIRVDGKFSVESEYYTEVSGTVYQVVSVEHHGDNRVGGWYTDVEGRPVE